MRSFAQHIGSRKTYKLAETAFTLMASRGVDPRRFVEWYATEGIYYKENEAPAQAQQWLQQELLLVEWPKWLNYDNIAGAGQDVGSTAGHLAAVPGAAMAFGGGAVRGLAQTVGGHLWGGLKAGWRSKQGAQNAGGPQNAAGGGPPNAGGNQNQPNQQQQQLQPVVQSALQALQKLSGQLPPNLKSDTNFNNMLNQAIGLLQAGPGQVLAQQQPAAAPTAQVQQTTHYDPQLGSPFLSHILMEQKIRKVCARIVETGHDPEAFANWYVKQGRYLNTDEFQDVINEGEFWDKFKGGVSNWWNKGAGGFSGGWSNAAKGIEEKKVMDAKNGAIQALTVVMQNQQSFNPKFIKHIQGIMKAIGGSGGQQPQGDPNAAPQTADPNATVPPEKVEEVKTLLQNAGANVTGVVPADLQKYAKEVLAIQDPAQRDTKVKEIVQKIAGGGATNRDHHNPLQSGDKEFFESILKHYKRDKRPFQKTYGNLV